MSPGTKVPIKSGAILGILKELRTAAKSDRPLAVTGASELVAVLTRELTRGGVASAVPVSYTHLTLPTILRV